MKFKQFIFVLLVQFINISTSVPSLLTKCSFWDSPCLILKARAISKALLAGIPELDIQPLDKILIDFIHVDKEGFKVDLRSMNVKGMSEAVIDNISVDMPAKLAQLVFHVDVDTKSRYISNGTLLSTPIYGDGDYYMKLENVEIRMTIPFDIIKDAHGRDLIILKSFDYTFDVRSGAQYRFENLYFGNNDLSDNMHNKMHKNWKFLTVTYGRYLFDPLTKKIFSSIQKYVQSEPRSAVVFYGSQ